MATAARLWERYHANRGDDDLRNELFQHYLPLADQQANAMARGRNPADREDIAAEARLGLLRALEQWDPAKGGDAELFLRFKIRAAVVDFLRLNGWVGKSVRQTARRLAEA